MASLNYSGERVRGQDAGRNGEKVPFYRSLSAFGVIVPVFGNVCLSCFALARATETKIKVKLSKKKKWKDEKGTS